SSAVWVSTASLLFGSFTVSKKRSMLNEATVNSVEVAAGAGVAPPLVPVRVVSGSIVQVRNAYSSGPVTFVSTAPADTSRIVVPGCASLSIRRRSGFSSNRGTVAGDPGGTGSDAFTPGSRKGRATPVTTP